MSSLPSDADRLLKANEILSQMGVEMAFIADDQDVGLLPINSFMMDLDELLAPGAPQEIIHLGHQSSCEYLRRLTSAKLVSKKYRGRAVEHTLSPLGHKVLHLLPSLLAP